jgi:hypothetical protein
MQVNFSNHYPKYFPQNYSLCTKDNSSATGFAKPSQEPAFKSVRMAKNPSVFTKNYWQNLILRIQRVPAPIIYVFWASFRANRRS